MLLTAQIDTSDLEKRIGIIVRTMDEAIPRAQKIVLGQIRSLTEQGLDIEGRPFPRWSSGKSKSRFAASTPYSPGYAKIRLGLGRQITVKDLIVTGGLRQSIQQSEDNIVVVGERSSNEALASSSTSSKKARKTRTVSNEDIAMGQQVKLGNVFLGAGRQTLRMIGDDLVKAMNAGS